MLAAVQDSVVEPLELAWVTATQRKQKMSECIYLGLTGRQNMAHLYPLAWTMSSAVLESSTAVKKNPNAKQTLKHPFSIVF